MALIAVLMLFVGLLFNNRALQLTSSVSLVYLAVLVIIALRKIPVAPVTVDSTIHRIVAGAHDNVSINITSNTKYGSVLFLRSSDEWVKVREPNLPVNDNPLTTSLSISPSLSGPSLVILDGHVIDRWGLIYTSLSVEALRLNVVPRARYASWLAKKYLAETKAGTLPLVSSVAAIKLATGLNRGIEYYGSKPYQPGDSLKNIDWKHSIKYSKLITKEFAEVQGQEAILLINLAVGDAEEADKQAYNIITAAISLAREQIPAAIAAYDEKDVVLATDRLTSQQLVQQTLDVAQRLVMVPNPLRYLGQSDTKRLRANIKRLRSADGEASQALSRLLQIEYENLNDIARFNHAAKAVAAAGK